MSDTASPIRTTAELETALVDVLATLVEAKDDPTLTAQYRHLLARTIAALAESREALLSERGRYRALLDAVPDPVSILSWEGTVLDLNKAGMSAYKRERDEIIGRPIETLNPDLPPDHLGPVHETLRRGETFVIEVTNMRADGTRFPVEVHSAAFEEDGEQRIVAVARDLSARHEAEARFNSLIEGIDQAVTLQDRKGRVYYLNVAAMQAYGHGENGQPLREMHWDDWLVVDEHGQSLAFDDFPATRALDTGRTITSQVIGIIRRSTQHLTWLSVTAVPQFPPGADRPEKVLTISSDITGLQRDKTLFNRVQELAQIGGWQWERPNDGLYLTHEAERILGAAKPLTTIEDVLACLRPQDRQRLHWVLQSVSNGTGFDLELQGIQADGTPFWIRMIGEPDPLDPCGNRFSGTLQDITERKRSEETLRVQAQTDALTGLMNRDAILEQINTRLQDENKPGLALLYIDLDRFKIVNDVLGHGAGDVLLIAAARRIREAIGGEGLIARFGGDEFLVACSVDDDPDRPQRLARQLQHAFLETFPLGGDEFNITASMGIARAPEDGQTPQQLIQSADVAMYDSKRRHRNGWQSFSPELAARQQERLQTETQLRRALDNGEFHLVYQPQVDLSTGRILYAEALVRWQNPQLGEMRPDRFIELAETTGDIVRIGNWVLQEACSQMRRWREQSLPIQRVAVNVSYRQFIGEDLGGSVRRVLEASGLPGNALELELTERVLVDDAADTLLVFDQLRQLGVQLSIDDFGEGYSALNYLRRLPIHSLKLSHSFLKGVPGKPSDVAICQAVIGIANSLGLGVVAEGVEQEVQRDFLVRQGVKIGQGFLFAPGLLPGEFAKRVAAQQDHA